MEYLFWFLAGLVVLEGLLGVAEGKRYLAYIRRHLSRKHPDWTPSASVFLPCKGLDEGLVQNVETLLGQDYPEYEVIIVTSRTDDEALPSLRDLVLRNPRQAVRFVVAGTSEARGEKVNNLMEAVKRASPDSEIYVFTDSDCRPHRTWLRELIAPLLEPSVGVSTGYRWYFPVVGNFASVMRSVWNASIATLLGSHDRNFCWGGSMAIRRQVFDAAGVLNYWRHSISDDYSLAAAVKAIGLRIHYEPRCLIGNYGDTRWRELLEWSTRQILITRIYSRRLWQAACVSQFSFMIGWWWAVFRSIADIGRLIFKETTPSLFWVHVSLVGAVYLLGVIRGNYRLKAVTQIRADCRDAILRFAWAYRFLAPLVSTLTAYTLLASITTSRLEWRGVKYKLISPREVRVVRRT